jgi:hypothetical protein
VLLARTLQAYYHHPGSTNTISSHSLLSYIRPRTLSTVFVLLDVAAFVVQLVGGASAGPTASAEQRQRGINIYMGGIAFQQLAVVVFATLCVVFAKEMSRIERKEAAGGRTSRSRQRGLFPLLRQQRGWRPLLFSLFLGLSMITVRIVYRLIEFSADGSDDPHPAIAALSTQESWFYVLEAVPMAVAMIGFAIWHPGRAMNGVDEEFPVRRRACCCCCRQAKRGHQAEMIKGKGRERLGSGEGWEHRASGDQVLLVARKP